MSGKIHDTGLNVKATGASRWLVAIAVGLLLLTFACSQEPVKVTPGADDASAAVAATSTEAPPPTSTAVPTTTPLPTATPEPSTPTPGPTASPTGTPVQPPGVVRDLRAANVTEGSITLAWEPPANSDAAPVDRYEVARDVSLGRDEHHFVTETTFTDLGLKEGTEYRYRVRAIGSGGIEGAEINIEEVTLRPATPEPTVAPEPTPSPTQVPVPEPTATPEPTTSPTQTPVPEPTATPQPTATPIVAAMSVTVATVQDGLPPYDRGDWRHWTDEDGDCQNTRHEVLVAESQAAVTYKTESQCQVVSGQWYGAYAAVTVTEAGELDVDHLVPLANTHQSGGWSWSAERRERYANSLDDPDHLIAVTAGANRSKGARAPDGWRPPDGSYWCEYAIDWIRVKWIWELTATPAEAEALQDMLGTCAAPPHLTVIQAAPSAGAATPTSTPTADRVYASCEEAEQAGEPRKQGSKGPGRGFPQSMVPSARDGDQRWCGM